MSLTIDLLFTNVTLMRDEAQTVKMQQVLVEANEDIKDEI